MVAPLRRCKLCRRWKWWRSFRWEDRNGVSGYTRRCRPCRNRGKQPHPDRPPPRYFLTRHAVHRYIERVRAFEDEQDPFKAARSELIWRMADAPLVIEPPLWCASEGRRSDVGYLMLDDDTALAVRTMRFTNRAQRKVTHVVHPEGVVTTVLTRESGDAWALAKAEELGWTRRNGK